MANIIDISARLDDAVPKLKLSEKEEYEINDDKNTVLAMQQMLEKEEYKETDAFSSYSLLFEKLLGKEAMESIEKNHPGVFDRLSTIQVLVIGITAGINGMTYEEAEEQFFRDSPKRKGH